MSQDSHTATNAQLRAVSQHLVSTVEAQEQKLAALKTTLADLVPKLAAFVEMAAAPVDAGYKADANYAKQAHALTGTLATLGIIAQAETDKVAGQLVADPTNALVLTRRLGNLLSDQLKVAGADLGSAASDDTLLKTAGATSGRAPNALEALALQASGNGSGMTG